MNEQEIRDGLKRKGFEKIRKKYGQRHMPIISADKEGMRIWVELLTNEYQTNECAILRRTFGKIDNFLK